MQREDLTETAEKTAVLERLRESMRRAERTEELVQATRKAPICGNPVLDRLLPDGGLPRGTLVEWLVTQPDSGAGTLALSLARAASGGLVAVIDTRGCFYPPAAAVLGLEPHRLLIVRPQGQADQMWALDQAARCTGVASVLWWGNKLSTRDFRRLQLACEASGVIAQLIRPHTRRGEPSWADLRLLVQPRVVRAGPRRVHIELLRYRGAVSGTSVECEIDDETGKIREARPLRLATRRVARRSARRGQREILDDRQALEQLADWCGQFSPIVAADLSDACDSLLLDVTGLAHLFGGEERLAGRVTSAFKRRGLAVRVAVADTIGAASAVACHFGFPASDSEWEENGNGPPSFVIVPPGQTMRVLTELPVVALRLPEKTIELLLGLGLYTIGHVALLPRDQLSARFGPELLLRFDQAVGVADEVLIARHASPDFVAEWLLEHPTDRRDTIGEIIERLIGRVGRQLAERGEGALRMTCRLDLQVGDPIQFSVGLYRPSARAEYLVDLVELQMEELRLSEPVVAVQVMATVTAPLEVRQQELFADRDNAGLLTSSVGATNGQSGVLCYSEDDRRELARLVDRLSSRLGRDAVLQPRLVRDAVPECSYRMQPMADRESHKKSGEHRRVSASVVSRPLWLEPVPIAVQVMTMAPTGSPIRFRCAGSLHEVANLWGPERIETGWWRGRQIRRDYYRVQTTRGLWLWLFRCRHDGCWFLHGEFD